MASVLLLAPAVLTTAPPAMAARAQRVDVTEIRHWSMGDVTRVAVQTTGEFTYKFRTLTKPLRIYFDILNARQKVSRETVHAIDVNDGLIKQIRVGQNEPTTTRIVLDLELGVKVSSSQLANPDRLMLEVRRKAPPPAEVTHKLAPPNSGKATAAARGGEAAAKPKPAARAVPKKAVTARPKPLAGKTVAKKQTPETEADKRTEEPKQVASVSAPSSAAKVPAAPLPAPLLATPARRNRSGSHSLTRALGLKLGRVVIDPGHGGRDTGTIGPTGLREKDVTLDIARRLVTLIRDEMGSEVVLTRQADTTVRLKERTALANKEHADLFISIHVNSSRYRTVNGVETFYLNFTRSRADLEVAARENAGSDMPMHELSNLVQKIALDDKVQESRDLASSVQTAVYKANRKHNRRARNRGVKKAPFVVLIGAQMPSVLVELGFISNPSEEKLMKRDDYRQEVARSLLRGISAYASSLSHYQVARAGGVDE